MEIKKFDMNKDLDRLTNYLRECFLDTRSMTSWLPERLHDLVYRMTEQEREQGHLLSKDFIYMWEDDGNIVGAIYPDGDAVYMSTKRNYEYLFEEMVYFAEDKLKPLFDIGEDGSIDFLVVTNDSLINRREVLKRIGYTKQVEEDYDNYVYPQEQNLSIDLPEGKRLVYGNEYEDEVNKWSACNMGFHPELESADYRNSMEAYDARKKSSMYQDSFECLVIDEESDEVNNVCSYCFVYVDMETKSAFVEPVSTREKYRHLGIGRAMMHGVIMKCKELGVRKCYVNSYDWRRQFYNAAGFITEDSIGFWHKRIKD